MKTILRIRAVGFFFALAFLQTAFSWAQSPATSLPSESPSTFKPVTYSHGAWRRAPCVFAPCAGHTPSGRNGVGSLAQGARLQEGAASEPTTGARLSSLY